MAVIQMFRLEQCPHQLRCKWREEILSFLETCHAGGDPGLDEFFYFNNLYVFIFYVQIHVKQNSPPLPPKKLIKLGQFVLVQVLAFYWAMLFHNRLQTA